MRSLAEIIGQQSAVESLRRLLSTGRIPHALLFRGPEGVGKATVARIFTATLLCERAAADPCWNCDSCRMLERQTHPDTLLVTRTPRDDGVLRQVIRIDQIRRLNHLAGLAPRSGPRRVFTIDPAERMNPEAQNALLKTLEQPPGNAILVLVASRPHLLLPTVRSRCFGIGFSALRPLELAHLLQSHGLGDPEARVRAALSGGRPGAALELDVEAASRRREELLGVLEKLSAAPRHVGELPALASALAAKDESGFLEGLEVLQGLLRDTARTAAGAAGSAVMHQDLAPRLSKLATAIGPRRAAELVVGIDRARGYLRYNTNRLRIAEAVLAAVAGAPPP